MNALLQEALIGTKHISHAGIIRKKDGTIKAKSPLFTISPQEFHRIENAFLNPGEIRGSDGVVAFMENFYRPLKADSISIYAKNDQSGIIIAQTFHHYIIGTYDSTMYASVAAEAVEKLGEYFRKKDK